MENVLEKSALSHEETIAEIERVLAVLRPRIQADGGDVELVKCEAQTVFLFKVRPAKGLLTLIEAWHCSAGKLGRSFFKASAVGTSMGTEGGTVAGGTG